MLRFRVFAGPNGSGKSTIIRSIKTEVINDRTIDFGVYVNADDIAITLASDNFSFSDYGLKHVTNEIFQASVLESGLVNDAFSELEFSQSYKLVKNRLLIAGDNDRERVAQIIANFLVKKLIADGKKCIMETVFSHRSKVDIMRNAANKGYKVYLYFVATESPEINVARVWARANKGGHDVPVDRIRNRYYRSLDMLYEAAQIAYQCYFFDNSDEENERRLIAHFKMEDGARVWDAVNVDTLPDWFIQYYVNKQKH
jgi:predicted ABC-type ATPase